MNDKLFDTLYERYIKLVDKFALFEDGKIAEAYCFNQAVKLTVMCKTSKYPRGMTTRQAIIAGVL